jgi:1-phosphatidylinositol-4-phosphate 5-kinase
MKKLLFSF